MQKEGVFKKTAFAISLAYLILLLAEFLLHLQGKSLCQESSCRVVMGFSGSEKEMLIAGMVYFALQVVFLATDRLSLSALLSVCGISAEAVFLMRQAFEYHTFCHFCLIVAAGVVAVAVLSFALVKPSLKEAVISGSMIASFTTAFLLTAVSFEPIRQNKVLIYSPSCPHCERVIQFCKEQGIELSLCRETNVKGILYCLGVKGVPALLVRQNGELRIIEGEGKVVSYLAGLTESQKSLIPELFQEGGVCSVGKRCN